jgi:hypothetical protein
VAALVALIAVGGLLAAGAIASDAFGAGELYERAVANVRVLPSSAAELSSPTAVVASDRPQTSPIAAATLPAGPTPQPSPTFGPSSSPPAATAAPTATPAPVRKPVDVHVAGDPAAIFAHEKKKTWCAAAGVQIVLTYFGKGDTSTTFQTELMRRVDEWDSYADSHNGKWGPSAMSKALVAYGVPGYAVRAYATRADALGDAARAIEQMNAPVLLLAWRGAHTWVMNGFRADGDPLLFANAKVTGAYILDPWYPDVSSIWGPSDPPGAFQDTSEMDRNYLAWKRPEGRYKDRDRRWIAVVPTVPFTSGG